MRVPGARSSPRRSSARHRRASPIQRQDSVSSPQSPLPLCDCVLLRSRAMALKPGASVGRYVIESPLGSGGMGDVYLAEDTGLHRRVALKLLPGAIAADDTARKRLVREAQAAAGLDHPNICTIYEVGEANGHSYIAMQYIDGETLAERLKRGPLDLPSAISLGRQVAEALAEAHRLGIVHRDIKPQNIML